MGLMSRIQASERAPSVLTVDAGTTTRLSPAIATTLTTRPVGISASAVAVMLWEAPAKLIRTVPNLFAGIPTETRPVEPIMSCRLKVWVDSAWRRTLKDPKTTPAPSSPATVAICGDSDGNAPRRPDHVLQAEGLGRLGLAQDLEGPEDDTGAEQPGDGGDQRGASSPGAEAVDPQQAADSKHRDEAKQQGRRRHSSEIETDVDRAQEAAEKIVEDQREEKESAAQQKAAPEDEIRRAHSRRTSDCILGRGSGGCAEAATRPGTRRSPEPCWGSCRPCSGWPLSPPLSRPGLRPGSGRIRHS